MVVAILVLAIVAPARVGARVSPATAADVILPFSGTSLAATIFPEKVALALPVVVAVLASDPWASPLGRLPARDALQLVAFDLGIGHQAPRVLGGVQGDLPVPSELVEESGHGRVGELLCVGQGVHTLCRLGR